MRCGFVVVWCLGMIICRFTTAESVYCQVSSTIRDFLKQIEYRPERERFSSEVGRKESSFRKHRIQKRAITWPYNCLHVASNYERAVTVFEHDTYNCCRNTCKPRFFICAIIYGSVRCPSNAMRCIAKCIYKNMPPGKGQTTGGGGQSGGGLQPSPTEETECSKTKKYVGNSYCIERSCIPFKSYN